MDKRFMEAYYKTRQKKLDDAPQGQGGQAPQPVVAPSVQPTQQPAPSPVVPQSTVTPLKPVTIAVPAQSSVSPTIVHQPAPSAPAAPQMPTETATSSPLLTPTGAQATPKAVVASPPSAPQVQANAQQAPVPTSLPAAAVISTPPATVGPTVAPQKTTPPPSAVKPSLLNQIKKQKKHDVAAPTKLSRNYKKAGVFAGLALLTVGLLAGIGFQVMRLRGTGFTLGARTSAQAQLQQAQKQQELANQYVAEVGKLIELPQEENPTVASITDVEKLKVNQPFFGKAKNGDVVIIYATKAILYDPAKKVIIDTAPVHLTDPQQNPNPTTASQP